jgi:predicted O-methyltransferase YrrM
MIVFGTCVGYPEKLTAHARPGLTASMSEPYLHMTPDSNGTDIFPIYAGLMRDAHQAGAECLVLMHDDLEFRDPELASKLRAAFADPSVAIVGLIGARGVTSLQWWEGDRRGRVEDIGYGLHDFPFGDVDSLDGMMLALSPWALENLTLEGLGYSGFHGYDAELCFQARAKGKRVLTVDIRAFHHSKGGFTQGLRDADAVFRRRWPLEGMVQKVRNAGTDSLSHFGNGYTHEGGLYLQQNPEEFAQLALLLKACGPRETYLEIGSASGGACRFLDDEVGFVDVLSIDDGQHPRAEHQVQLLPERTRRFIGDSHSPDARAFVEAAPLLDVAFIDGDHSYEGVTQDLAMVLPRCRPGALVVLHDTVACEGVKRAWAELLASGKVVKVAEYVGAERPLGIGVATVQAQEKEMDDPWAMLRTQTADTWDIEAMYDAVRGEPVSATPCVHMIVPSYREGYDIVKRTEASRAAIIQDLNDHGLDAMRTDIDGDSLVQRMRQRAMHVFLKSPATHLLWCDLDIEALDPTCVRKMLKSGHDIVAGACPFKNMDRRVVCNFLPDMASRLVEGATFDLPHGCLEVQDAGTGFQLVSRKAIVAMMQAHPELLHWSRSASDLGEPLWALYDTGVVDGTYESEDFMFCRYWQKLGGKVYVYVPATFRHYGTHGFEASLLDQLGLVGQAAT